MDKKTTTSASRSPNLGKGSLKFNFSNLVWVIAVVMCLLFAFMGAQSLVLRHNYHKAEKLVDAGQYTEALQEFQKLEETHMEDVDAYIQYCGARISYDEGNIPEAADQMDWAVFRYITEERAEAIEAFRDTVNAQRGE